MTELALFGDRVVMIGRENDAASRVVYTKAGKLVATRKLRKGGTAFVVPLDATSWVTVQEIPEHNDRLSYQDEYGRSWQKEYSSAQSSEPAGSADGRIAIVGDFEAAQAGAPATDRISVLAKDTGTVLFSVPLPVSANVHELSFDPLNRLWVIVTTPADDGPFVLVSGPKGERVAELSVDDEASKIKGGPVFLPDGRAVLSLVAWRDLTLQTSFAGSTRLGPGQTLIELDIDRGRALLRKPPPHTACLAPTPDGGLLGCVPHSAKPGAAAWLQRCDLVKWKLPPVPEERTPPLPERRTP